MKRDLKRLAADTFDVVIIGGGVYGAFMAFEAALRGLSAALIEKADFGAATSANSQKTIHGGFRYLQHGDIIRMRESIRERTTLMRIAPHLVHPLPVLVPTYGRGLRSRETFAAALKLYDWIAFDRNRHTDPAKRIPGGRLISRAELLKFIPFVPAEGLTGAALFYDAQVYNSERFTLALVKAACRRGAQAANYLETMGFLKRDGRVEGVQAKDVFTGDILDIRARTVVNACGPWVFQTLAGLETKRPAQALSLVKSFNIVTKKLVPSHAVGIYGKRRYHDSDAMLDKGNRLFFITPWREFSIVGTALAAHTGTPGAPAVSREEMRQFLADVNDACPGIDLREADVRIVHRGLLPGSDNAVRSDGTQILKKYRIIDHEAQGVRGILSVLGVKYTTARDVAEKTVQRVCKMLEHKTGPSRSSTTPVAGGDIEDFESFLRSASERLGRETALEDRNAVLYNYGTEYEDVLNLHKQPDLMGHEDILKAQIRYGIREEMAQRLADVIFRRTQLGTAGHPGRAILELCSSVMAQELDWNPEKTRSEVDETDAVFPFLG